MKLSGIAFASGVGVVLALGVTSIGRFDVAGNWSPAGTTTTHWRDKEDPT